MLACRAALARRKYESLRGGSRRRRSYIGIYSKNNINVSSQCLVMKAGNDVASVGCENDGNHESV